MLPLSVKFKKLSAQVTLPSRANEHDVGMDVYAREHRTLEQGEPHMFKLGFACEFPQGHVALIQDRSSMGKRGVKTLGGVIDPGYRGEWAVLLVNTTDKEVVIEPGDRIAQVLFIPVCTPQIVHGELSDTDRGAGGFGSSGK